MYLDEMLSYFDGNIYCQLYVRRPHCWLRNVGIKYAVLTDSCTAVAFLTCQTRTQVCWRLKETASKKKGKKMIGKLFKLDSLWLQVRHRELIRFNLSAEVLEVRKD